AMLSLAAVATRLPSELNSTLSASDPRPFSVAITLLSALQMRILWSPDEVTTCLPSGLNTAPLNWPLRVNWGFRIKAAGQVLAESCSMSQMRAVASLEVARTRLPFGLNVTLFT